MVSDTLTPRESYIKINICNIKVILCISVKDRKIITYQSVCLYKYEQLKLMLFFVGVILTLFGLIYRLSSIYDSFTYDFLDLLCYKSDIHSYIRCKY